MNQPMNWVYSRDFLPKPNQQVLVCRSKGDLWFDTMVFKEVKGKFMFTIREELYDEDCTPEETYAWLAIIPPE